MFEELQQTAQGAMYQKSLKSQEPGEQISGSDSESEKKGEQSRLLCKGHLGRTMKKCPTTSSSDL